MFVRCQSGGSIRSTDGSQKANQVVAEFARIPTSSRTSEVWRLQLRCETAFSAVLPGNRVLILALRVIVWFVFLWKTIFHKIRQCLDGLRGVWTLCFQSELGPLRCS